MSAPSDLLDRLGGVPFEAGAHRTLALDDPARLYVVEQGHLDVFAAELRGDEVVSRRPFAARVPAGAAAFGAPSAQLGERRFALLGVPSRNAVLVEGRRARLSAGSLDVNLVSWIDEWVRRLSDFLAQVGPLPRGAVLLEADPDVPHPPGAVLSAHHLDVVWVSADSALSLLGRSDLAVEPGDIVPLSERTWVALAVGARVSAVHTPRAFLSGAVWDALDRLAGLTLRHAAGLRREDADAAEVRYRSVREAHRLADAAAEGALGSVLRSAGPAASRLPAGPHPSRAADRALRAVALSLGVDPPPPPAGDDLDDLPQAYLSLARRWGLGARRITLEPGWWRRDGPSFAGLAVDGRPVAVVSNGRGRFRLHDPATGQSAWVTRREAAGLAPDAVMLYAGLSAGVRGVVAAVVDAASAVTSDVRTLLLTSVAGSLVALATPLATGHLLATVIPRADVPLWTAGLAALFVCALGAAAFQIVQAFALIRIEGRLDERLQAALWSRLLSLPPAFFRRYAAGDLADRLGALPTVRSTLSGSAVRSLVGGLFSLSSFALLVYYSFPLAAVAAALLAVLLAVSLLVGRVQMHRHREALRLQGVIDALLYQLLTGLDKLRVANAEPYLFARWARLFADQRRTTLAARRWAAAQLAFNALFTPLASAVLLSVIWLFLVAGDDSPSLSLAAFLVAFTAFGQLAAGVTGLIAAATALIAVIPLVERVRPVLEADPEPAVGRTDPGDLAGEIELRDVHFRYVPDGEPVLAGVSLRIRPGDYVALVGPSGAGKSTVYRLLFGFERPDSGAVLFDGHDLLTLDLAAVRRHLGVVLQDGQLAADTIRNNVAGSLRLTTDEVWEALRSAGLEADVRSMPMGLHTLLHEGGGGLSGGQRQRLLVARALARKPRILLFDEATSALDNRTQSVVQDSLARLSITRVVIAHRLTTVRDVDRVYVLDRGRIVESGPHAELLKSGGRFAELARRQLV